jgi:hypothetical protein
VGELFRREEEEEVVVLHELAGREEAMRILRDAT